MKDRETNKDAEYRRAEQDTAPGTEGNWRHTKIHVGRNKGIDLCDLDREAVQALITNWLPSAKANPKPLADDRRLIVALEQAAAELAAEDDDQIPMENQPY